MAKRAVHAARLQRWACCTDGSEGRRPSLPMQRGNARATWDLRHPSPALGLGFTFFGLPTGSTRRPCGWSDGSCVGGGVAMSVG
jgi:hypothetical protein